jgi:hypothetical protein
VHSLLERPSDPQSVWAMWSILPFKVGCHPEEARGRIRDSIAIGGKVTDSSRAQDDK